MKLLNVACNYLSSRYLIANTPLLRDEYYIVQVIDNIRLNFLCHCKMVTNNIEFMQIKEDCIIRLLKVREL